MKTSTRVLIDIENVLNEVRKTSIKDKIDFLMESAAPADNSADYLDRNRYSPLGVHAGSFADIQTMRWVKETFGDDFPVKNGFEESWPVSRVLREVETAFYNIFVSDFIQEHYTDRGAYWEFLRQQSHLSPKYSERLFQRANHPEYR